MVYYLLIRVENQKPALGGGLLSVFMIYFLDTTQSPTGWGAIVGADRKLRTHKCSISQCILLGCM